MKSPLKSLLILCCGFVSLVQAQNPHPAWRNYTTDHGLPSSEVHCILQDSKGYMWFGTDNGLSRFDGYEFKNYGVQEGLKNNMVNFLQEDKQNRLWMATLSQNIYYFEKDSIYPYAFNDIIQSYKSQFGQFGGDFYYTTEGTLYTELPLLGILKISKNGSFQLYKSQMPLRLIVMDLGEKILSGQTSFLFSQSYNRNYYDNSISQSVELYRDSIPVIIEGFSNLIFSAKYLVRKTGVKQYLMGRKDSYYFIDKDEIRWQLDFDKSERMGREINKAFIEGKDQSLFLGLYNGGGVRKYQNLKAFKEKKFEQFLKGFSITSLFRDRQDGLWVSTVENGVFYRPKTDFEIYDISSGLSSDKINALALKKEETVFIGLENGDVFQLNGKSHRTQKLPDFNEKGFIFDMLYDSHNQSLVVSFTQLGVFENGVWEKIPYFDITGNLFFPSGQRITSKEESSFLWIANFYGFLKLNLKTLTLELNALYDLGIKERTRIVFEDFQNRVWVGTLSGLYELKEDTLLRPVPNHPEFSIRVEDITQLSDSTLVIATKGEGILLWKAEHFQQLTTIDGLTSNMIENVHVDDRDNIWVGTLAGLNKVERLAGDSVLVTPFTMFHGLPSNEINRVKTRGKDVWVATTKGLVHFEDNKIINRSAAQPILTKVLVNNKILDATHNDEFSHRENNFVFHYVTLDFHQNGKINYRYRLLPAQTDWSYTQLRSINFSALNNGKYVFDVQSRNEDGFWSESSAFEFEILPPFWGTWWFLTLVVMMIGFLIYRFNIYRTKQLLHEAEVVKQMAELERSALRAQMNPHFIFNCLTSVSNFIDKGDKAAANHYLVTFAKLIRATLNHSRTNKISLEDELQLLENYIKLEQLRFENKFDYHLELGENVAPFEIEIPPMMLLPFVENAIIHGLVKKEGRGRVDLLCELENDNLKISITDNGVGIKQSKKQKTAHSSLHKSVGMTITKRRLELISSDNEIKVRELKDKDGAVIGTQVVLLIRLD